MDSRLTEQNEDSLPLVDHHVHSILARDVGAAEFEMLLTESSQPAPTGTSHLDSQIGFALRRHCAPLLGLEKHCSAAEYLERRSDLGYRETAERLLRATGVSASLIDTGVVGGDSSLVDNDAFSTVAGHRAFEIVRLESVAESLIDSGTSPADFPTAFRSSVEQAARSAVGFKSIIAYRFGFDFDPARPSDAEVVDAVTDELKVGAPSRVSHPTLLRFLLWTAVDQGLPIQLHAGYGDSDLDIARCDPALLMPWLRSLPSTTPILLLHCYPYHREAGYLAQVFSQVYLDVGLSVNYTGAASTAIIREAFELAPFGKLLYSSDAWGLPELHYLGARLWRNGLAAVLQEFLERDEWDRDEALRVARMVCSENATRVYRLPAGDPLR